MNVFTEMTKSLLPSSYRIFRSDSWGKNFGYFIVVSLIGFIITMVIGVYMQVVGVGGIEQKIPEFSMSDDAVLTADLKVDSEKFGERLIINTDYDYTYDEATGYVLWTDESGVMHVAIDTNSEGGNFVIIGRNASISANENELRVNNYSELDSETLKSINKDSLISFIKKLFIPAVIVLFLLVAIRLALWNLVNTVAAACISSTMGVKNTFGQLYAMSLRAYTVVYFVKCILFAFHISLPFKTVLGMLITGLVLSKGIKDVKAQLDTEADAFDDSESDYAYRLRVDGISYEQERDNNSDSNCL
jgi:hypothetical protein